MANKPSVKPGEDASSPLQTDLKATCSAKAKRILDVLLLRCGMSRKKFSAFCDQANWVWFWINQVCLFIGRQKVGWGRHDSLVRLHHKTFAAFWNRTRYAFVQITFNDREFPLAVWATRSDFGNIHERLQSRSLDDAEFVNRRLLELLARLENGGRKRSLVRRVRVVLRLQTKGIVLVKASASWLAVQKVTGVELNARLGRVNFHFAA